MDFSGVAISCFSWYTLVWHAESKIGFKRYTAVGCSCELHMSIEARFYNNALI